MKGADVTPILQNFAEISDRYDAVFCDLWGVVHNGVAPFEDAVTALQAFRAKGGRVILLTNAPLSNPARCTLDSFSAFTVVSQT